jgi:hypothetical protein
MNRSSVTVIGVYAVAAIVLILPGIQHIFAQIAALVVLSYVFIRIGEHFLESKRMNSPLDHTLQHKHAQQTYIFTLFGILLLIGETGGAHSPVQALLFGILALSVPVYSEGTLILLCLLSPLFLFAVHEVPLVLKDMPMLLSYPMMLPVILYAKMQHRLLREEKKRTKQSTNEEQITKTVLEGVILPRIKTLQQLVLQSDTKSDVKSDAQVKETTQAHLHILEKEVRSCVEKLTE